MSVIAMILFKTLRRCKCMQVAPKLLQSCSVPVEDICKLKLVMVNDDKNLVGFKVLRHYMSVVKDPKLLSMAEPLSATVLEIDERIAAEESKKGHVVEVCDEPKVVFEDFEAAKVENRQGQIYGRKLEEVVDNLLDFFNLSKRTQVEPDQSRRRPDERNEKAQKERKYKVRVRNFALKKAACEEICVQRIVRKEFEKAHSNIMYRDGCDKVELRGHRVRLRESKVCVDRVDVLQLPL